MVDAEPTYFPLKTHPHESRDSVSSSAAAVAAAAAAASVVAASDSDSRRDAHEAHDRPDMSVDAPDSSRNGGQHSFEDPPEIKKDVPSPTSLSDEAAAPQPQPPASAPHPEVSEPTQESKPPTESEQLNNSGDGSRDPQEQDQPPQNHDRPDDSAISSSRPDASVANGDVSMTLNTSMNTSLNTSMNLPSPKPNGIHTGDRPQPILTNHSGVDVIELDVGGMSIMRRVADSALNATQILKLAGLDKSKRTRIIERELVHGGEKVQGGYGKYQGTWVSFDRGLTLCAEHGVTEVLAPLLDYDLASSSSTTTTTTTAAAQAPASAVPATLGSSPPLGLVDAPAGAAAGSVASAPTSSGTGESAKDPNVGTRALPPLEPSPGPEGFDAFERNRDIVTELFLNESRALGDILAKHRGEEVRVDVPIDDHGHTALHWASSLGRIELVRDLVNMGADYARGNYAGESPLVRAVLVTNNSDLSSFGDLLDILYPCMHYADNSGRTVLHHISLTAGIKGRSDASRYYLETILEWVVRNDPHSQLGVNWLIEELVNAQDHNGDTALNIAARIGNTQIARQLIDVGASVTVPNRAGLRPVDFGVLSPAPAADPRATLTAKAAAAAAASVTATRGPLSQQEQPSMSLASSSTAEKRKFVLEKLQETIAEVDASYESELAAKNDLFASVHEQLNEATHTLNNYHGQQKRLRSLLDSLDEQRARVDRLSAAIHAEDARFRSDASAAGGSDAASEPDFMALNGIDADEPFRVHSTTPAGLEVLPPVLLKARIAAYELNEAQLKHLRDELQASSLEREYKYRRVVSQCTGVEEDKVDGLLSSLVQAVESDMDGGSGNPLDLSRVAGLLETVRR